MKSLITTLMISVLLTIPLFSQEKTLSFETPTLSAGAEYSQFLEQQKKIGNSKLIEFNGKIPSLFKTQATDAITTIEGINFDQDASNSGYYHIPPDPIGAAGPTHLVSVTNTSIEWFTKAGVKQNSQRLGNNGTTAVGSFFESLAPLTGTFDPKVIYDQYNSRFVVVALEQTTSPSQTSSILVAVSKTNDPNGGWWFYKINSRINIRGQQSYADYPGLAVSSAGIYITANMFSYSSGNFTGGRLWIINKTPFYTGGTPTSIVRDHITSGRGYNTTYQPA